MMKSYYCTVLIVISLFSLTLPGFSQIYINEFMAFNGTAHWDEDLNSYSDWIELYNAGSEQVDLAGYYITDNLKQETRWAFPAGSTIEGNGFLLLWADKESRNKHVGFSLNSIKEEIGLYTPSLELIDKIKYTEQAQNVSYGRCADGGGEWCYFGEHSAGTSNGEGRGTLTRERSGAPHFWRNGLVNGQHLLKLSMMDPGEIRYTLDGSDVNYNSPVYSDGIIIDSTTVVRAKTYEPGKIPGHAKSYTYFINEVHELPIISLSTNPRNLFDPEMGIYVNGNGYDGENWRTANYQQLWHRPAYVEYHDFSEKLHYGSRTEIKVFGSYTSRYGQKPLTLYFEKPHKTKWNIFESRGVTPYASLVVRNSGQDWIRTMICDGLFNSLVIDVLDIDAQAYRPSILYVNGAYWGIHNIREKVNEEHFGYLNNIDPSRILLQKRLGSTGQDEVDALIGYAASHDLGKQEHMAHIKSKIDVDEYLNYMISEFYSANMDWPKNNVRMWKKMGPEGKWRWILVDLDVSMGIWGNARFDANSLARILDSATVNTELFRALMQNREFKEDFVQRSALLLNTVFKEQRVIGFIDSLSNDIAPEMPRHIERWKDSCSWSCGLASMDDWHNFLNKMLDFAAKRPEHVRENIRKRFDLGKDVEVVFKAKNGRIVVNHCDIPFDPSGLYFEHASIILSAIPDPGYEFDSWVGILLPNGGNTQEIQTNLIAGTVEAGFKRGRQIALPQRITGDTVLLDSGQPYYIEEDLVIDSGAVLRIEDGVQIMFSENSNILVHGGLEVLGSKEKPVIFEANAATGSKSWGAISFENASQKCLLTYLTIKDATRGRNTKRHLAAVNSHKSELEMDHCTIIEAYGQPIYAQYSKTSIQNCLLQTPISSDIINLKYGMGIVEGCELKGNSEPNTDAIDYDDMIASSIVNNRITNFLGYNSDGIDLGEGSDSVVVEGNYILNCSDKGISVGQASSAKVLRNLIIGCAMGIGIKDSGSYAAVDQNIFYKDSVGVACFVKRYGRGGGKAKITNCVFSQSLRSGVWKDKLSRLKVSYSLSDNEILKGIGNVYEAPRFIDPENGDFTVSAYSPCVNQDEGVAILSLQTTRSVGARMLSKKALSHSLLMLLILWVLAVVTSTGLATYRR